MALLVGGSVSQVTLARDTSGLTQFKLPSDSLIRLRQSLVTSAGYLGSSCVGCGLFAASLRFPAHSKEILLGLGVMMGLTLLVWVRNFFGGLVMLVLGSGL